MNIHPLRSPVTVSRAAESHVEKVEGWIVGRCCKDGHMLYDVLTSDGKVQGEQEARRLTTEPMRRAA